MAILGKITCWQNGCQDLPKSSNWWDCFLPVQLISGFFLLSYLTFVFLGGHNVIFPKKIKKKTKPLFFFLRKPVYPETYILGFLQRLHFLAYLVKEKKVIVVLDGLKNPVKQNLKLLLWLFLHFYMRFFFCFHTITIGLHELSCKNRNSH